MTFFTALLFVAVTALVLTGALVLLMWLEKKLPSKQYDERQQTVRGNAHKWALLTGFCYFAIIAMLECVLPSGIQADLLLIVVVGMELQAFVLCFYCSFHDAYLPLTRSPKVNIIVLYLLSATQFFGAVSRVDTMKVTITEDGFQKVNFGEVMLSCNRDSAMVWGQLILAVMGATLATLELVRYVRSRTE